MKADDRDLRERRDEAGPLPDATRTSPDVSLRLAAGTVLAGRYRLGELLGIGAMGMVYRAQDEDLGIEVALKVLRPELSQEAGLLERFRRELILARQVSHRHVVRIHDIGRDGGLYFLSMDLVTGRSLRDVLEEAGALEPETTLELGRQIAAALAAAHEQGVVHRDLKPSNVLINDAGEAFVTDFGVARSLAAGGLTRTGAVVGTPDYLSPEQAQGKPVDTRSDVYAFGILLFEMLTGDLPFSRDSLAESVAQRLAGPSRKLRQAGEYAPAWLRGVVARCLDPRPSRRFASGAEVLGALEARSHPARRLGRAVGWLAAGAVSVGVLLGVALLQRSAEDVQAPAETAADSTTSVARARRIALLPLVDQSGRSELAWLAAGLPDYLAEGLAEDPNILVADPERVARALADLRIGPGPWAQSTLAQLSELFDADRLVVGNLRSTTDSVSAELQVVRPGAEQEGTRFAVPSAPLGSPQDLVVAAEAELRRLLETGPARSPDTTEDPEALEAYLRGVDLLVRGEAVSARPLLEKAVGEDPGFAAAWLRYSEALAELGLYPEAEQAAARAVTELGDARGRLALEAGAHRALLVGDPESAQELLRELVDAYPEDVEAKVALGEAFGEEGQLEAAMRVLEQSVASAPNHPRAWFLLGKYAILSGQPQRAVEELLVRALVIQKRLHNEQGVADALNAFGIAYRDLGDLRLAAENYAQAAALREKIGDRRGTAVTLRNLAQIDIARGEYSRAEENLHGALEIAGELGDETGVAALFNDLGVLEEDRGRYEAALEHYRRALQARREQGDRRSVAESANNVGFAYFLLGQLDNASVYWREAEGIYAETGNPVGRILVRQSLAQLQLARGQWSAATRSYLETLAESRELDFTPAIAVATGQLGRLAQVQGRMAAALEFYAEALAVFETMEDVRGLSEYTLARAETLLAVGRLEAADEDLTSVESWLEESSNHEQAAEWHRLRAQRLALAGRPVGDTLETAVREAETSGSALAPLWVELAVGEEDLRRGRTSSSVRRARAVLERAEATGHPAMQLRAHELLVAGELAAGRVEEAGVVLSAALASLERLGEYWRSPQLFALAARVREASGQAEEADQLRRRAEREWRRVCEEIDDAPRHPPGSEATG